MVGEWRWMRNGIARDAQPIASVRKPEVGFQCEIDTPVAF